MRFRIFVRERERELESREPEPCTSPHSSPLFSLNFLFCPLHPSRRLSFSFHSEPRIFFLFLFRIYGKINAVVARLMTGCFAAQAFGSMRISLMLFSVCMFSSRGSRSWRESPPASSRRTSPSVDQWRPAPVCVCVCEQKGASASESVVVSWSFVGLFGGGFFFYVGRVWLSMSTFVYWANVLAFARLCSGGPGQTAPCLSYPLLVLSKKHDNSLFQVSRERASNGWCQE